MDAIALLRAERQKLKASKAAADYADFVKKETKADAILAPPLSERLFTPRKWNDDIVIDFEESPVKGFVRVIPNVVTEEEEQYLLFHLNNSKDSPWQSVRNRRLQCFGGDPVENAARLPLPGWLQPLARYIDSSEVIDYKIDHCLVNEYKPGQGILPHTDGPSYHPCVACLSIGDASGTMRFQEKLTSEDIGVRSARDLLSVRLEPRSLVVFWGAAYSNALHSIVDVSGGSLRVSLTLRKILI